MIREKILIKLYDVKRTQADVCKSLGLEYSALNQFLNGRKGMWFERIQDVLTELEIDAVGSVSCEGLTIQKAVWLEIRERKLKVRAVAKTLGIAYCTLNNFIHGRIGMSVDRVERLMSYLNIKLV